MKKVVFCLLLVSLSLGFAVPSLAKEGEEMNQPFKGIETYQIFYGAPTPEVINEMKAYDLVILEPYHYRKEQIQRIQSAGTMVLGYITTMEIAEWNQALMKELKEEDFYKRNGKKVFYPEWKSYLMDFTSKHYQTIVHKEINQHIIGKQFDGLFLDTVGDIDNEFWDKPDILKKQRAAMVSFLKEIKEQHKNLPIVQNWGFDTLAEATAPYVDGIMWESFDHSIVSQNEWAQNKIQQLLKIKDKHGVQVFTVAFKEWERSSGLAHRYGFIHTYEQDSYDQWTSGASFLTKR